jgi:hypothetical protein
MKKILISATVIIVLCVQNIFAQLPNAEKILLHTQTAKVYQKGQLGIYSNMNFYSKIGDALDGLTTENFEAANYWLVAGNMVFTYGIMDNLDASLGIRLYQDTHYSNEFNLPDDLFLTIKAGSFNFARNRFSQAVLTSFRFPTGEVHNYPFTEYTTNSFQYSLMYAVSYYSDPYLPNRSLSFHFNSGFWFYNEHGTVLYEPKNLKATISSSDFRMALAFVYPTGVFDFRVELTGMLFMQKPNRYVYSAEEWAFLSPSVRFKPLNWMNVDLGIDFRISPGDRNYTQGVYDHSAEVDVPPNFPTWRVQMGLGMNLNLIGASMVSDLSYEEKRAKEKIEVFESIVEEKEKAESIQGEIENLKKVRQEAEKEINELKKILDE